MGRLMKVVGLLVLSVIGLAVIGLAVFSTPDIQRSDLEDKYTSDASLFMKGEDGARLHYRDQGNRSGASLILIHGSNASLHSWEPWISELSDDFRLISLDLPGHGLTGAVPNSNYSVSDMSQYVIRLMDALNIDQAYLAGNSMGGAVSLTVALDHPERVSGLILISAAGMQRDAGDAPVGAFRLTQNVIGRQVLRHITPRNMVEDTIRKIVAEPDRFITEEMVTRYWELMRMEGTRDATITRFAGYATSAPIEPRLPNLAQPALILWGEKDTLIKPVYGERMSQIIPNNRLIIYPNAGHMAMEEVPEQSAADARAFIKAQATNR